MRVVKSIPETPGVYPISIGDYDNNVTTGGIVEYENNRGKISPSEKRIRALSVAFNHLVVGMIHVGMYLGRLTILDGHHRTYGIRLGIEKGTISEEDRKQLIMVKVVDIKSPLEFLVYRKCIGDTMTNTKGQDITNPDYRYGAFIYHRVRPLLIKMGYSETYVDCVLSRKRVVQLAYIIHCLEKEVPAGLLCFTEVCRGRRDCTKRFSITHLEDPVKLSRETTIKLMNALAYYLDYIGCLAKDDKGGNLVKDIINNASWFGVILTTLLSEEVILPIKPWVLANRTCRKGMVLSANMALLGRQKREINNSTENSIWKSMGFRQIHKNYIGEYTPCIEEAHLPKAREKTRYALLSTEVTA
jgi:hypothetical protein